MRDSLIWGIMGRPRKGSEHGAGPLPPSSASSRIIAEAGRLSPILVSGYIRKDAHSGLRLLTNCHMRPAAA